MVPNRATHHSPFIFSFGKVISRCFIRRMKNIHKISRIAMMSSRIFLKKQMLQNCSLFQIVLLNKTPLSINFKIKFVFQNCVKVTWRIICESMQEHFSNCVFYFSLKATLYTDCNVDVLEDKMLLRSDVLKTSLQNVYRDLYLTNLNLHLANLYLINLYLTNLKRIQDKSKMH